jgi:hypothetical protein
MLFVPEHHILQKTTIWDELRENKDRFLHKGVSAFAGYCRTQANKYGIKGSRVAASRLATEIFEALVRDYGAGAKLKEVWHILEGIFKDQEHCEFIVEPVKANPGLNVRMLSVCGRKVQEHITLKEAHKIFKHVFDEYGQRALAAEKNEGVDWKALMHAVRVCNEAVELLSTKNITYPSPIAPTLLKIRKGELPYKEVSEMIEQGLLDLESASGASTLPSVPDKEFADDFLYRSYINQEEALEELLGIL